VSRDGSSTLLVALLNNTLELYKIAKPLGDDSESTSAPATKTSVVEMHGHRYIHLHDNRA
jgi:hypothetical protein